MTALHGFELLREQPIPEYDTQARLWRHIATGAEVLSLENADENKVFSITFRTPLDDSTGVAHILEHSVLCGSQKYPLKDPFVELIKGSLNTYLNAFTYPDKTCYPAASQNVQDFYNMIEVYLDAVFYPLLERHTFEQQGWHYELEELAAPLSYKGVVFNEMKGAYASPDRVLAEYAQQSLFPDTTYRVAAGGRPAAILDLTYEQLKSFHEKHYHPANARIFFYGDDDPEERLRILDARLSAFARREVQSTIGLQPYFAAPRRLDHVYAAGENSATDNHSMLVLNWLLDETTDPEVDLALVVLEQILIGSPASPLRKALIESGLGEDLAGWGLVREMRQMYFSTGLKGIAAANVDQVEALMVQTLRDLAANGIDPRTVEAALNTVEFWLRENNTGYFPRGLSLMLRSLVTWLYDGDPFALLLFTAPLATIKARLAAGEPYFERLLHRCLVENPHRTTVVLHPDADLAERETAAEQARLAQERAALTEADLQAIIANTRALKLRQETPDPPEVRATVPTLALADLDKENKHIPCEIQDQDGLRVLYHDLFTNGIVYLDLGLDLHTLPQELLPYARVFSRALLEMGAGNADYVQLAQRIGRDSGGIWPELYASAVHGTDRSTAWLFLHGKAMASQADKLLAILHDILHTPQLDNQDRFRQIVLEEKAEAEARLANAGTHILGLRLRAHFHEAGWAEEQMMGVSYLLFLRELAAAVDADWPAVLATLDHLRRTLVNRDAMLCNVTVDAANWARLHPALADFLRALPQGAVEPRPWSLPAGGGAEGLVIPAQVNYVGQAANLYELGYHPHGAAAVINHYLNTTWLWEQVRVRGGAYGGFCHLDRLSGVWMFLSYRDPNVLPTLAAYQGTSRFLHDQPPDQSALTKAIIGAIGHLDAYQLPDAKGWTSLYYYLVGETDAVRQRRREEILATTVADFQAFGEVLAQIDEHAPVVVMGGQPALVAANAERPGWLTLVPVL